MVGEELSEKFVGILFHAGEQLSMSTLKGALRTGIKAGLFPVKGAWDLTKTGISSGAHTVQRSVSSTKVSVERLSQNDDRLSAIPVSKQEISGFDKHAKRHQFAYSLVRAKHDSTRYTLYFKQRDIDKFQAVTEDFIADKDLDKAGWQERLQQAKVVAQQRNKEQEKTKSRTKTHEKTQHRPPKARER